MRIRGFFVVGAVLLAAVPALAQRSTATIRGAVTDPTAAVVASAKVVLLNEETGFTRTTATNADGLYSFADIPTGSYRIEVNHPGFKAEVRTKVVLNVADVRAVNIELSTGDVAEVVNVEVSALQVRTFGGDVSGLVTGEQVRELPLNGRNFLQLATLMPGVSSPDFLNVKDKGLLGGSDLAVSGGGVTSNMWTVDGANNNDVGSNRTILVYPSLEAIEEFKIHRNSYGAEFGGAAGAQINIVTRTGTNEFHGDLFYSGRREALNSTNYFLEQAGQDKENLDRNDFGWTFSGPIMRDKIHFFASQEWNREVRGSVRAAQVPSALERVGDFSQPSACSFDTPVDPLTGAPFPGNVIPQDRLSPGGLLYMNLFPQPNTTPGAGGCNNWVASLDSPINWRQENVRLDWSVSSKTRLMLRYTQDSWTNGAPNLYSNLWGDDPFPAVDSNWDQPGRSVTAQLTQNIGASAVNTLSFSYSSNSIDITRGGDDPGLSERLNAAIPSLFPDSIREYGSDRGHPLFWGGIGYGNNLWNEAPFRNNQDLFILKNDYSAVFGKHFVKIGALASMNKKNEDSLGNGSNESPQFWGATGLNNTGVGTGNSLADFLLRDVTFGFSEFSSQRQVPQRWKDLEFYVTDSWKLSPRVTVDLGVRYSNFYNSYSDDNLASSFDPAAFNPALAGDPCNGLRQAPGSTFCQDAGFLGATDAVNRSLYPQDLNLFAPRIGFAWDVNGDGRMAVRAGFGQFYLRERLSPGLNIAGNPPFTSLRTGVRYLDRVDEPCAGCFGVSNGRPTAGREQVSATPNNLQWNLSVEREIAPNTTAEIGYVGSKGRNLLKTRDINAIPEGDSNGNGVADRVEHTILGEASNVRPFQSIGGRITFWDHSGESIYHSLQTQLRSRFGRGSQFQASYTWSRTIADEPLDNSDGGLSASMTVLDERLDRGLAQTHRKHVANASLVLSLPLLEEKSPLVRHVFGDWQIATIAQYASGQALTVFSGSIPGLNGGVSGTGYTDNQRPNRVPGVSCKASGGPKEQIINPDAFTVNGMRLGTIGDSGRGVCEGPDFKQVDFSLYKNIRVSNRVRMQLRFDVFNVFNRVNFVGTGGNGVQSTMAPPSATISSDGIISDSAPQSSFGRARLTKDPRQAQVGIKLSF